MSTLPDPTTPSGIHDALVGIDSHLLRGSEKFIRQQCSKPIERLISGTSHHYSPSEPGYFWLNVFSLFYANQQLNESCNKMWAASELANVTRRAVWKQKYEPVGPDFGRVFALSTLIPTIYYAQISAMISIMSSFGCMPVLIRGTPFYLVRTSEGWRAFLRRAYVKSALGKKVRGWHEQIIETYFGLMSKNVRLPILSRAKMVGLKNLRNQMHYEILGDLKMWRVLRKPNTFSSFIPLVDRTISSAIDVLNIVKAVSTGCDVRYGVLRDALRKDLKLL